MKLLFVCNQNKHRSKTAEHLFAKKFETQSAGLFNEKPVSAKQLDWADIVIVMEDAQRSELAKRFPKEYMKKRIVSLGVPDVFQKDQPELIQVLRSKMEVLF